MINNLRWCVGGRLLRLAERFCDVLDTLDPPCFQIRNPILRRVCLTGFFLFGVLPAFLMVCFGALIIGKANAERFDNFEGDIL
jgi:hypothetical protein